MPEHTEDMRDFFEKFQLPTRDLPLVLGVVETRSPAVPALFRDIPLDAIHHSAIKCVFDQLTKLWTVG